MKLIRISNRIHASIEKVWEYWITPKHIQNWNFASTDWHCPSATNNFKVGGEFHYTMAAKDNSFSFDFWGTYQLIENQKRIEIILGDGRHMNVIFETTSNSTLVTEEFEPEKVNSDERQQSGWQMILDNFKKYVEDIH